VLVKSDKLSSSTNFKCRFLFG